MKFLRELTNILMLGVTILGIITLILPTSLKPIEVIFFLFAILLVGSLTLIVSEIKNNKKRIGLLEEKYKRVDELIDIKADIKTLKSMVTRR